ncbi:MAG: tRNA pseudouridine(55) synthase TruB, partial [Gemmatimonadetes bacterium]|nr:tRNA pseudouridine(55) synthase TruB [Gemmatimonadota bacterium]
MTAAEAGGVLPVDKPAGPTSHDVVGMARRALETRRVGHTGTLDPFATGLLLLCVGPATRLSEYLTGLDKTYEATALLGTRTETEDAEGAVVSRDDRWKALEPSEVRDAVAAMVGPMAQVPPAFSAKKVAGEAAHRRARRGESFTLEAVVVEVYAAELLEVALPEIRFRVRCSSGTYVRALARDLGESLGTGAHLTALRRTRVGAFPVDGALPPPALEDPAAVSAAWI